MNEIQMSLFRETPPLIESALGKIKGSAFALPNMQDFVCHLGKCMTTASPGRVIFAAAPSHDAIVPMLGRYLDEAHKHAIGTGAASMCPISIPTASTARALQHKLLGAYQEASRLQAAHRVCTPQLEMGFDWSQLSRDPFAVVTGLVAQRPYDYYVLNKASDLVRSGSNVAESVEHVRFIMRMAEMMHRTHVVIASPAQVNRWLRTTEIAESTDLCLMKPYDIKDPAALLVFRSLLHAFDELLPWSKGECLLDHAAEINAHVWGCPTRLHAWILKALMVASARGATYLTWQLFLENRPIKTIREAAEADFKAAQELYGSNVTTETNPDGAKTAAKVHYRGIKPGKRKLHRDPVGSATAA
jgi:hypothetical protein